MLIEPIKTPDIGLGEIKTPDIGLGEIKTPDIGLGEIKSWDRQTKKRENSEKYKRIGQNVLNNLDINHTKFKKQIFKTIYHAFTDCSLPLPGEQIRIRTQSQISLISMILKIIHTHLYIDALTIITYTLNKEALNILISLLSSAKICELTLVLASSYIYRKKEYYELIIKKVLKLNAQFNIHLIFANCHSKITLARCHNDYYQFEGSMNYSANNMVEQLIIENNKKLYDYDYNFVHQTLVNRKNKALNVIC